MGVFSYQFSVISFEWLDELARLAAAGTAAKDRADVPSAAKRLLFPRRLPHRHNFLSLSSTVVRLHSLSEN
jgi:hypothetical protein